MVKHSAECHICQRLEDIKNRQNPAFIADLPSGAFVIGDIQQYRGYCLLLCNSPVADLEELDWETRLAFLRDMALCSEAVSNVVRPHKMNVSLLGNSLHHLHFHLHPRQINEDPVFIRLPPWSQKMEDPPALDPVRDAKLIEQLRDEIERLKREYLP
jgi:diadenosine tetraphosphate (Ap4A) HIT family hydrolase